MFLYLCLIHIFLNSSHLVHYKKKLLKFREVLKEIITCRKQENNRNTCTNNPYKKTINNC